MGLGLWRLGEVGPGCGPLANRLSEVSACEGLNLIGNGLGVFGASFFMGWNIVDFELSDLHLGQDPGTSPVYGAALAEACSVCLERSTHAPGVKLSVTGLGDGIYRLSWEVVTLQMFRTWNDPDEAVEYGAACLAELIVKEKVGHMVLSRSFKGTGFDYLLGDRNVDEVSEAERAATYAWSEVLRDDSLVVRARLEVSGIMRGRDGRVRARVDEKLEQMKVSDGWGVPGYAVVVEFGRPLAVIAERSDGQESS